MLDSTKLLSVVAVVFFYLLLFAVALLQHGRPLDLPRLVLLYLITVAFFAALYNRRRLSLRHQHGGLYRSLGDIANMLSASMVALFNCVDLGVPLPVATGVRLVATVVAAYFLYYIIIRPLEEEAVAFEEAAEHAAMIRYTRLLSVMAVVLFHILLAVLMLEHGLELQRLVPLYLLTVAFYVALYFRRRLWLRWQVGGFYRGLGDTAVMLFASMVALFNGVDLGVPLPVATGFRVVAVLVAAYFLYRIIILSPEEEAAAEQAPMVHSSTRLLTVMAVVLFHMLFAVPMLENGRELPRLALLYLLTVGFYGALHTRRRFWLRQQRGGPYRRLGDTAVMLFAFMVVLFNGANHGVPLPIATGVRLVAVLVAAYYRVIIGPLEEEAPQMQVDVLAIV
jgi:hypothetical protein